MADEPNIIRIALADREQVLGQALARLVGAETDMRVTGVYTGGESLMEALESHPADVAMMDPIGLTSLGMDLIRRVLARYPQVRVVVLTANQQEQQLFSAVRAGARGYISKSADIADVINALRAVHYGEALINSELAVNLLQEFARLSVQETGLTARERDVLNGIVRGETNYEIARALGLSEKTVKNYISNILSKLNVRDRTQAAVFALRMGLITDGDWRLSPRK
jgi:DNA-binding NarL/FixJ family response regulator